VDLAIGMFVFGVVFLGMQRVMRRSPRAVAHLSRHAVVMPGVGGGAALRPKTGILSPVSGGHVAEWATKTVSREIRSKTERLLVQAGGPMPLGTFLTIRAAFVLGLTPFFALMVFQEYGFSRNGVALIVVGALFIPQMPRVWLKRKARKRSKEIELAMPDALDLLVVCVEGGLSIDGALQQVARRTGGLLAEELTRLLTEVSNGASRRDAFINLGNRSQSESLVIFCTTIVQADKMGMSIAATLRTLVDTMRMKRRLKAETQARKAPIKMLPLLAIFMMPSLFIVILGPMVLSMIEFFGSMGV
jgi:tight adherence protein C